MSYFLPPSTARLIETHVRMCKNLGLLLDKYPPETAIRESKGKGEWLREIVSNNTTDPQLTENAYQRWLAMTRAIGAQHFSATLDWRMVVGLGGETVLETDLTLHHLYGIPYIPGSALKGLTRAYVTAEEEGYLSKKLEEDNEVVNRIFGSQKRAGTVVFFDAMPSNGVAKLALDIMNPHYPDYYRSKRDPAPPTNDQSPNPVTFLTVADTTFAFALAPRRAGEEQYEKDVEQAKEWLQAAIQKYGVGGKTSAGYGYFKEIKPLESSQLLQTSQTHTAPITEQKPRPTERIRPNIPKFREGQDITGAVVAPTDEIRRKAPDATAFLRYQSYQTKDVLIVVNAEEAQNWKPGDTRICQFLREEERDGCTVLVCQTRPSKKKKE